MQTAHSDISVMLAAGGTGGHLFPAYALAEELARRGIAVDLVTDTRVDNYAADFPARSQHVIPSATLRKRTPGAAFNTALTLSRGIAKAHTLIGKLKPSVVMGFGGYPTFPPLIAARLRGVPGAIHEANAVMGRANRMLLKRVDAIATSFEQTKYLEGIPSDRIQLTGNPVRGAVIEASLTPYRPVDATGPINLLVFGGSQGARYFSDTVPPALAKLPGHLKRRLRVLQQCREEDVTRVQVGYEQEGITAHLDTFFRNLPELMAQSHLVIGRAGASSCAELAVLGRPSLLVPLPHALDNDQLVNATRLAEVGGALCIEQDDLDANRLAHELVHVFQAPERLASAAQAARRLGRPDAVARLADLVITLANRRARLAA